MENDVLKTQEEIVRIRTERAQLWLRRARLDYQGLNRIMPSARSRSTLPSDPALAVQLLQQSVEKAVKAVFVASGEDEIEMGNKYGHASLALYLAFLEKLAQTSISRQAMEEFFKIPGYSKTPLPELISLAEDLRKRSSSRRAAPDSWHEWAGCPAEAIQQLYDRFVGMRNAFTVKVNQTLRTKELSINLAEVIFPSDQEVLRRLAQTVTGQDLPREHVEALSGLLAIFRENLDEGLLRQVNEIPSLRFTRGDRTRLRDNLRDNFLSIWAQIALLALAALTFPHSVTSRYPPPLSAPSDPLEAIKAEKLGSDHYCPPLGIVVKLPEVARLAGLTLDSLTPAIKSVASFSLLVT